MPLDIFGLSVIICNMATNYSKRKEDIIKLRFVNGWTLQRIGEKYGISRERVRQITGNTGHIAKKNHDILKDEEFLEKTANLTNDELSNILDVPYHVVSEFRSGIRHAIANGDSGPGKAAKIEELISEQLRAKGIKNELMPFSSEFDILALDIVRIDVKAAFKPLNISSSDSYKYRNPLWSFTIKDAKKKKDTDFYICVIVPNKDIFIIPRGVIPKKQVFLRFCWPTARPEIGKYQKYLNAYHLITEFAEESMLSITPPIESVPENISV